MVPKLAVDTDATLAAEGVPGGKPEDPPEAGNPKPMTELGVGGGRLSLSPGVKYGHYLSKSWSKVEAPWDVWVALRIYIENICKKTSVSGQTWS